MAWQTPRRILLTCCLVAISVLGASAANAYWRGAGSGTGTATTGTTVAVTLTPGTPTASLYPGAQASVSLTVSNPNASAVSFGFLTLDTVQGTGGFAVDASHSGCSVATLSFTPQTNGGAGWTVPAKVGAVNGTLPVTLANSLAMGLGAASACQGATVTVYLAAGS